MIVSNVSNSKDFDLVEDFESQQLQNSTSSSFFGRLINFICIICRAEDELQNAPKINRIKALLHMLWYREEKVLLFDPLRWLPLWGGPLQAVSAGGSWPSATFANTTFSVIFVIYCRFDRSSMLLYIVDFDQCFSIVNAMFVMFFSKNVSSFLWYFYQFEISFHIVDCSCDELIRRSKFESANASKRLFLRTRFWLII